MDLVVKKTPGAAEREDTWLPRKGSLRNVELLFLHLCSIYPESFYLITRGRQAQRVYICIIKEVIEFKCVESLPFRIPDPFVLFSNHFWQFFKRLKNVAQGDINSGGKKKTW